MKLTENFDSSEFRCKCGCGKGDWLMAPELVQGLQELRELIGQPIVINSAYRSVSSPRWSRTPRNAATSAS